MSTIDFTKNRPKQGNDLYTIVTWPSLASGDDGAPCQFAQCADRTVQISGTLDGTTVTIEGSIDGENYHNLTDPQGNALAFTLPGIEAVTELVAYIRPKVAGGGPAAAVTVNLLMKG